jgi:hypothetical protein
VHHRRHRDGGDHRGVRVSVSTQSKLEHPTEPIMNVSTPIEPHAETHIEFDGLWKPL